MLGRDVLALDDEELSAFRGQTVSMIFQEPALALDPVYTIGQQIAESVMRHEGKSQTEATARALEMLEVVRIPSAKRRLDAYPHEMSGGMRQRAMIALALACKPKILLADEPTTALDATVQIQILLLLRELQREFGMSVIFVTHDIGVAIEICDRVAVMYAGQIVEQGTLQPDRAHADPSLCAGPAGLDRPRRQARPAAGDHPGHAALARQGAGQLLVRAALHASRSRAASKACRPMCRCRRTGSPAAFWPSRRQQRAPVSSSWPGSSRPSMLCLARTWMPGQARADEIARSAFTR